MSYRTSYLIAFLLATFSIVPALGTDVTPIRCPANCPGLSLFEVHHINENSGNQYNPHVSGDLVAYQDELSVKYYSFLTGTTTPIPNPSSGYNYLPDVYNGKIVFTRDEPNFLFRNGIYDTANATTSLIDAQLGTNRFFPSIGGQTVAVMDQTETNQASIFATDYSSGQPVTTRLTTDGRYDFNPTVSPDGSSIVWYSLVNNAPPYLYAVKLAVRGSLGTWNVSQIASDAFVDQWPGVDGQWIVYMGQGTSGDNDLYIRSIDGTIQRRLVIPGNQQFPSLSGGVVLFSSVPDGSGNNTGEFDIFMYQISTGRLWRVTDTPTNEDLNDISVLPDGSFNIAFDEGADLEHRNVYGVHIVLPSSVTTAGLLQQLIDLVAADNLRQGISNSLDAKLQDVQAALNAARNNNIGTACNLMTAFINDVNAQSGKSITTAQAQALLNLATQIKQSLGCA
jgi:hypothetical protein